MSSFDEEQNTVGLNGSPSILIGNDGSNPLLIGTVGADRLVNSVANYSVYFNKDDEPGTTTISSSKDNNVERTGNVNIIAESGNLLGLIGGSSSLNIGGIGIDAYIATYQGGSLTHDAGVYLTFNGEKSSTTLNGNTTITLSGTSSAAGVFSGGSSIALGGLSESIITGSTHLIIDNNTKLEGYEGINAAVSGGGISLALLGGESKSEITGNTIIDLKSGTTAGVLGGGLAIGAQSNALSDLTNTHTIQLADDDSISAEITFDFGETLAEGGHASAISHNIGINLSNTASTLGVMGGGLAIAYQYEDATKQSYAQSSVDSVTIQIGEEANTDDVFADSNKG